MIAFEDVSKRFVSDHVPGPWVLRNVSFTIPSGVCVGIVGNKGAGKSTLLRLLAGLETPTEGRIERDARIATPSGYSRSFQPLLTGRQNAKFICRINGNVDDLEERLAVIEGLAGLGNKFEKALSTYTPVMKSRLSFALSMAFDFDVYISDDYNFAGAAAFGNKDAADAAIEKMTARAALIMATKGPQSEGSLRRFCRAGIWLHDGRAEWFDDIDDAIAANRESQSTKAAAGVTAKEAPAVTEQAAKSLERIRIFGNSLTTLAKGLKGRPAVVSAKASVPLVKAASQVGMTLLTPEQFAEQGCQIPEGAIPVLKKRLPVSGEEIGLYDLGPQCQQTELNA